MKTDRSGQFSAHVEFGHRVVTSFACWPGLQRDVKTLSGWWLKA